MLNFFRTAVDFLHKRLAEEAYWQGKGVRMGEGCRLIRVDISTEPYLITMGDRVSATRTRFETHDGGVWVIRDQHPKLDIVKGITIGSNVFIGYGCIILPGVSIGDNVVIGAGSVVAKDIPSNCVAVGAPARPIRSIEEYADKSVRNGDQTKDLSPLEKRAYYAASTR